MYLPAEPVPISIRHKAAAHDLYRANNTVIANSKLETYCSEYAVVILQIEDMEKSIKGNHSNHERGIVNTKI